MNGNTSVQELLKNLKSREEGQTHQHQPQRKKYGDEVPRPNTLLQKLRAKTNLSMNFMKMVDCGSIIRFPLVIADSGQHMPEIKPGQLGWCTSALPTELQEVRE